MARDGLFRRGETWWIRTDPVTGKAQSTYCKDRPAARLFRAKRERLAADPAHAAAETARLDEWIRRVIAVKAREVSRGEASAATLNVYRCKLGHWLRLAPDALLSEMIPPLADRYWEQRKTERVSDHTIKKEFDHAVIVLRAAKRAGCYPHDVESFRPPALRAGYVPRERALSREEIAALLPHCSPFMGALVCVCVALGCRLSEALRMRRRDVAPTSVRVRGTKTEGSDRWVPIYSIYRGLIERALPALPLGPLPNNLRRDLAAACKRAGIPVCTPNDLRRTHATLLLEAGVDRDVIRRGLGHAGTQMLDAVYGQPSTEALGALAEQRLAALPPLLSSGSAGTGAGNQPAPAPCDDAVRRKPAQPDETSVRCPDCNGRGWHVGDCHPQETCGTCDGSGTLQKRNSEPDPPTAQYEKHRADFEIRTRDLRFTKPLSFVDKEALSSARRRFPRLNAGELLRSGAYDDRRRRAAVTNSLQCIEDTRQALADHVARALGVRDARAPKPGGAR